MEDKRIAEICSDLDDLKRRLDRLFYIIIAVGLVCLGFVLSKSGGGRTILFCTGVILEIAAVFISICAEKSLSVLKKVMRYYTETTKL